MYYAYDRVLQSFYSLLEFFLSSQIMRNGICLLRNIPVSLSGILMQEWRVRTQIMNHHTTKNLPATPALSILSGQLKNWEIKILELVGHCFPHWACNVVVLMLGIKEIQLFDCFFFFSKLISCTSAVH